MTNLDLAGPIREVAIPSLRYCEEKYGHDDQARLNLEAALLQAHPLVLVLREVASQDARVADDPPVLWLPDRHGVRMHIAALEDETREALEAWHTEKSPPGAANPARWPGTRNELIQVGAVGLRAVRALVPDSHVVVR